MRDSSLINTLEEWIGSCGQPGKTSRNTIAVGIVVLDHLLQNCPVNERDVFSRGGELKGARSGLGATLEKHGVAANFLKEATNRQAGPSARRLFEQLSWGADLAALAMANREAELKNGIAFLAKLAREWLERKPLTIVYDRQQSPIAWIQQILQKAKGRSGGKVEQHPVGAKLSERFPASRLPNNPVHAGDVQTGRSGDFQLHSTVYHVTAAPSSAVIAKCGENLKAGLRPVLLAPRGAVRDAEVFAREAGTERRIMIVAIEDFIAMNIVEMAGEADGEWGTCLQRIIETYNRRLAEVETDLSLKIDLE